VAFDAAWPRILGALLDILRAALLKLPTTTLPIAPRMADFATLATAAEEALGWCRDVSGDIHGEPSRRERLGPDASSVAR